MPPHQQSSCSEVRNHQANDLDVGLPCWFAQWVFYTQLFLMFLSASAKVMSVALQASEHLQGQMLWGDVRKQHPPEQVGPPRFHWVLWGGRETREWLLPKMWPQDATARTRHAPVHKLVFYLL